MEKTLAGGLLGGTSGDALRRGAHECMVVVNTATSIGNTTNTLALLAFFRL
jgi:hypothetical protein